MAKLIVLEGTDSSGKETHTGLLEKYLIEKGYKVIRRSFPNYTSGASFPVKAYLRGDYGKDANLINPYAISIMYAVDRYASFKTDWQKFMNEDDNTILLFDRYVQSNMIHQMSKITSESEGRDYLEWLDDLEFIKMGLPRPDNVFLLNMPTDLAIQLKQGRANKITGSEEQDIHESNRDHLEKSYRSALTAQKIYNWEEVKCSNTNGSLRSIEEIQQELQFRTNNLLD